jgi:hypothetical protein
LIRNIGFRSGVAPRVAIAVGWMLLAVATVVLLDRRDAASSSTQPVRRESLPPSIAEARGVELHLQAGFRVERWTVMVAGVDVEPESFDHSSWTGRVVRESSEGQFEVFVEAQAEDQFAEHRHALEIGIRDGERRAQQTIWGEGDISTLVNVASSLGE